MAYEKHWPFQASAYWNGTRLVWLNISHAAQNELKMVYGLECWTIYAPMIVLCYKHYYIPYMIFEPLHGDQKGELCLPTYWLRLCSG